MNDEPTPTRICDHCKKPISYLENTRLECSRLNLDMTPHECSRFRTERGNPSGFLLPCDWTEEDGDVVWVDVCEEDGIPDIHFGSPLGDDFPPRDENWSDPRWFNIPNEWIGRSLKTLAEDTNRGGSFDE